MTALGTLKPELMAALEAIDQQSPVDFWDAETLVDTGLVAFNPGNDYWYELTSTGELQLNKYAAWDELRAENARLKAVLEWYADAANYAENWTSTSVYCPDSSDVQKDEGERARKALKGDK